RGARAPARPAANSRASGSPSSRSHNRATASAFSEVSSKAGRADRARSTNSATLGYWRRTLRRSGDGGAAGVGNSEAQGGGAAKRWSWAFRSALGGPLSPTPERLYA